MFKSFRYVALFVLFVGWLSWFDVFAEENHKDHEGAEGVVVMDQGERAAKGVVTGKVALHHLAKELMAPGEVVANAYFTTRITTRIPVQIMTRHARLGDTVRSGQKLITLSSVEMATAQGELLVADREWQRVKKLGRDVVSGSRYIQAHVARQQAYAKVLAYGMKKTRVDALLKKGDPILATGKFDLLASQNGTVVSDQFVIGEVIKPGRVLMEISDESVLWVEAKLSPQMAVSVQMGAPVRIKAGEAAWVNGKVIQRHHRLDETTRTQSLRIEVDNRDDRLHPGQFVTIAMQTAQDNAVIALPEQAIVLMQGGNTVFKLEGDELHPQPVEIGNTRGGWVEIKSGLSPGDEIVTRGVFLLKSLMLKSRIGDHD
ncbi:MAG: efflux RND transporter periplasmic adaptor subunit [Gammaproteobacteria bacterium]